MLQFKFDLVHVAETSIPGANYVLRKNTEPCSLIPRKLIDSIPVHRIKIVLASKTPKQDHDDKEYDHHAQPQQPVLPPGA